MSDSLAQLRGIITRLRAPGGCPWDREQTADSLCASLIEEAYEVVDAIERKEAADLEEELGDLLINILMQAEIASDQQGFSFDSLAQVAADKLVRRHPHVFGASTADTGDAVLSQWEEIKRRERVEKGHTKTSDVSLLDGVVRGFPALVRAQKIQKKAAKANFDWISAQDVLAKVREEIVEVEEELSAQPDELNKARLAEEMGDLLFSVVNLSRFLSVDAESALHAATEKFVHRFRLMEREVPEGRNFSDLSLDEMNLLWEQTKLGEHAKLMGHSPGES